MIRSDNDSLSEILNNTAVHPTNSYDVDDCEADGDDAAAYTIAHVNTGNTTRKTGPAVTNHHSSRRSIRPDGGDANRLGVELHERRQPQHQPRSSTTSDTLHATKPQQHHNNIGIQYPSNFTAWKRKKDSKIVGLKHYGLESPRHQLHDALSDSMDDSLSKGTHIHTTPPQPPKRGLFTGWWMKNRHQVDRPFSYRTHSSVNHTATTTSHPKKNRLFAVEKEEEMVRKNVAKNPFVLFYLGNLAAIKVVIYYFSK